MQPVRSWRELLAAIRRHVKEKGIREYEIAREMQVKAPAVSRWLNTPSKLSWLFTLLSVCGLALYIGPAPQQKEADPE